jgi:hypothetical protein
MAAAIDRSGDVVVWGTKGGVVDFGNGPRAVQLRDSLDHPHDVFVASFDARGAPLWSTAYHDTNALDGAGIAVDRRTNDILISGIATGGTLDLGTGPLVNADTDYDLFVAKLSH